MTLLKARGKWRKDGRWECKCAPGARPFGKYKDGNSRNTGQCAVCFMLRPPRRAKRPKRPSVEQPPIGALTPPPLSQEPAEGCVRIEIPRDQAAALIVAGERGVLALDEGPARKLASTISTIGAAREAIRTIKDRLKETGHE